MAPFSPRRSMAGYRPEPHGCIGDRGARKLSLGKKVMTHGKRRITPLANVATLRLSDHQVSSYPSYPMVNNCGVATYLPDVG